MLLINVNASFEFVSASVEAIPGTAIAIQRDALENLSVSQLVAIAKSMNPELKVNNKQARSIILDAIDVELENVEIQLPTKKARDPQAKTSKDICYEIFATLDMTDKVVVREQIKAIEDEHGIPKRVIQSYASNFRKANP